MPVETRATRRHDIGKWTAVVGDGVGIGEVLTVGEIQIVRIGAIGFEFPLAAAWSIGQAGVLWALEVIAKVVAGVGAAGGFHVLLSRL